LLLAVQLTINQQTVAPGKSNKKLPQSVRKQTARMSGRTRRGLEHIPKPPQHLLSAPAPFESDWVPDPDFDFWNNDFIMEHEESLKLTSPPLFSSQGSSSGG
jgi:hypothetical protein